jgi:hypothetical protein
MYRNKGSTVSPPFTDTVENTRAHILRERAIGFRLVPVACLVPHDTHAVVMVLSKELPPAHTHTHTHKAMQGVDPHLQWNS